MVATIKSIGDTKRRTIIALASNGANVRAWEDAFQYAALQIEYQSHFMLPEYSIPAHLTLALSVEVQMGIRVIKASRTRGAARRLLDEGLRKGGRPQASATPVVTLERKEMAQKALDDALRKEEHPGSSATPVVALEEGGPGREEKPEGSFKRTKSEKAAAEEEAAQVEEATAAKSLVKDEGEVHKGEVHARVVREEHARVVRKRKMRDREEVRWLRAIRSVHVHNTNTNIHTGLSDVMLALVCCLQREYDREDCKGENKMRVVWWVSGC